MPSIHYYSPTARQVFNLNGDGLFVGVASPLRSYHYGYTLGFRGISNVTNDAKEVTVEITSTDNAMLDALRHAVDSDLYQKQPGSILVDDYETRCYCLGMEAAAITPEMRKVSAKIALIDGTWSLAKTSVFNPQTYEGKGYDYPVDYAFDYGATGSSYELVLASPLPAEFSMVMYGPCTNPTIKIGDNSYAVLETCANNERIEVDSRSKSITKVDRQGNRVNIFAKGVRSTGQGSGEYIFEKVQPGYNPVTWNETHGIDMTVYAEDTVPPWSL